MTKRFVRALVTTCALALVLFVNSYQKNASAPKHEDNALHLLKHSSLSTNSEPDSTRNISPILVQCRIDGDGTIQGGGEPEEYGCCKEMNGDGQRDAM